jgi:hypothetical protein
MKQAWAGLLSFLVVACADDVATGGSAPDAGGGGSDAGGSAPTAGGSEGGMAGTGGTAGGAGGAGGELAACGASATTPNSWIATEFSGVEELSGDFTTRQFVELPRIIRDSTATGAKYAFDLREEEEPADPRAAFVNVSVHDLVSKDAFGAAISSGNAPGAHLFLSNVELEPNWPMWESYATTNYDGMVLDGSEEIYAEDLTIRNWNADSAIDIKSTTAQFVCLTTEGDGNRTLRFWQPGPHYLVLSSIQNETGAMLWFADCGAATLNVYESTFNGSARVPSDKISCDKGDSPQIVYLTTDPRTTGEMHPMFSAR